MSIDHVFQTYSVKVRMKGGEKMAKGNGSGGKGSGGWPSTTGKPSGGGRTNSPAGGKGK